MLKILIASAGVSTKYVTFFMVVLFAFMGQYYERTFVHARTCVIILQAQKKATPLGSLFNQLANKLENKHSG